MSVPSIAARLGHSGETVTHRYLHLLPGSEAAIAGKLDAMVRQRNYGEEEEAVRACQTSHGGLPPERGLS